MEFQLAAQLAADTLEVAELPLCRVLLMDREALPWYVLVPRRDGLREIHELDRTDQQQLIAESSAVSRAMQRLYAPDKLNIAAIGNLVPQLHLHHVARWAHDPVWPQPVWGRIDATRCLAETAAARIDAMRQSLATDPPLTA